jgi:hypothetical protein
MAKNQLGFSLAVKNQNKKLVESGKFYTDQTKLFK